MNLVDLAVRYKVFLSELQGWTAGPSFLMLYYMFIRSILDGQSLQIVSKVLPFPGLKWIVAIAPLFLFLALGYWSMKRVRPALNEYDTCRNPEWQRRMGR